MTEFLLDKLAKTVSLSKGLCKRRIEELAGEKP
jgi:hypothetical protein